MDITKLFSIFTNSQNIDALSEHTDAQPSQVSSILKKALPILMKGMQQNAATEDGAAALDNALNNHADKYVNDKPLIVQNIDTNDGSKILDHVLGDKKTAVVDGLAKKEGISALQVGKILAAAAPLLLSLLGKQKKQHNVSGSGISGMLSSFLGGNSGNTSNTGGGLESMIASVLSDKDGDGKPDILSKLGGLFGKS